MQWFTSGAERLREKSAKKRHVQYGEKCEIHCWWYHLYWLNHFWKLLTATIIDFNAFYNTWWRKYLHVKRVWRCQYAVIAKLFSRFLVGTKWRRFVLSGSMRVELRSRLCRGRGYANSVSWGGAINCHVCISPYIWPLSFTPPYFLHWFLKFLGLRWQNN